MKRTGRKLLVLLLVLMLLLTAGCGKDGDSPKELPTSDGFTNDVVMKIGTSEVSYKEANIYLMSMREEVEALYGSDIWDYVFTRDEITYSELMKQQLLEKIEYIKLVCYMADEFGVALEADDILNVNEYTQKYMANLTEETAKKYGITEELIRGIYQDNVLARKIYETITLNADTSYTVEDYLTADFEYLYISRYYEDSEGNVITIEGDEYEALREKAEKLRSTAEEERNAALSEEDGSYDFFDFAKDNSDASTVELTAKREDLPEASRDAAFNLADGELSQVIAEEDGFYIYYCVSSYDESASQEAEEALINAQAEEYFEDLYGKWKENVDIEVNEALWAAM